MLQLPEAISGNQKKKSENENGTRENVSQSSLSTSENNQRSPKKTSIRDVLKKSLNPVYTKYITIGGFIYLTYQLGKIAWGIYLGVPPEYRPQTIWIAIFLIGSYPLFKIYEKTNKYKKLSSELYRNVNVLIERNKNLIEQLAKPKTSKYIDENLTYRDVEFAVCCLFKKIDQSRFLVPNSNNEYDRAKNIIIGIDRGGAIVGGALAKMLGLSIAAVSVNYPLPSSDEAKTSILGDLKYINFNLVNKILLVDDVVRKGLTIAKAKEMLDNIKKHYHEIGHDFDYRTVSILYEEHYGMHRSHDHKPPDFLVYFTKHTDIQMPWDTITSKELLKRYENELKTFCNKNL